MIQIDGRLLKLDWRQYVVSLGIIFYFKKWEHIITFTLAENFV